MITDEQIKKYGRNAKAINEILRICKDKRLLTEFLAKRAKEVKGIMGELFDQDFVTETYVKERIEQAIAAKDAEIAENKMELANKDAEIAENKAEIAKNKAEIARLQKLVAAHSVL